MSSIDTEKELREKNIFIQTVLDNLPIGVALNEIDKGSAIYMNRKFEEIYGWPKNVLKDIISFFEKVYPDKEYRSALIARVIADISSGDPSKMHWEDCEVTWADGSKHYVNAVNIPLPDQNIMVSTVMDVTEQKLAGMTLIQAKERAEEMNRLKSVFLSNMSHELRTPLNGILGFTEILSTMITSPEQVNIIDGIYSNGKRLNDTLNSILDLAEIEANRIEVIPKEVDLISVINNIVHDHLKLCATKNIGLETDISEDKIIAFADLHIFKYIADNLLSNAVKFTHQGKIVVRAWKEAYSEGDWFCLSVKDTGIGISPDKLSVIWDEFRQGSEGFSRNYQGSGIGLTIAKKAVGLMKGEISVHSDLGEGSIFTVKFPLVYSSAETNASVGPEDKKRLPLTLYVEDDKINRYIVKKFLNNICIVDEAEDGLNGLELASEKKYDLILLDINLGNGMNGMELVKRILELEKYSGTPIIAVTAYAMWGDRSKIIKGGFTHYLEKPFSKNELTALVSSVTGRQAI